MLKFQTWELLTNPIPGYYGRREDRLFKNTISDVARKLVNMRTCEQKLYFHEYKTSFMVDFAIQVDDVRYGSMENLYVKIYCALIQSHLVMIKYMHLPRKIEEIQESLRGACGLLLATEVHES